MTLISALFFTAIGYLPAQMAYAGNRYQAAETPKGKDPKSTKRTFQFEAYNLEQQFSDVPETLLENHAFGPNTARREYVFKKQYIYEEAIAPGNPYTKKLYRKPVIYRAVKTIEARLRKNVKKNLLTVKEAESLYNKTLEVAIAAISQDTGEFEKTIKQTKDKDALIALFNHVKIRIL